MMQALGVAAFLLACASIALNVLLLRRIDPGSLPASASDGNSQSDARRAGIIAANRQSTGASASAVNTFQRGPAESPAGAMAMDVNPDSTGTSAFAQNSAPSQQGSVPVVQPMQTASRADAYSADSSAGVSVAGSKFSRDASEARSSSHGYSSTQRAANGAGIAQVYPASRNGSGATPVAAQAAGGQQESDSALIAPASDSKIPAAFQPLSSDLALTEGQKSKLSQLQDQFVQDSGANSSTPADPERWKSAVAMSDEEFRAWFGDMAFLAQQREEFQSGH